MTKNTSNLIAATTFTFNGVTIVRATDGTCTYCVSTVVRTAKTAAAAERAIAAFQAAQ